MTFLCPRDRLNLHLFFHDVHASAGLQKPPLITLTELKFGLPASRELWTAKTATEWRDNYLKRVPRRYENPTFMNALEDPDLLHKVTDFVDVQLCAMTLLHGYWYQIWALAESKKFYPASRTTHHLSLITSHRELYRDLMQLSDKLPSMTKSSPGATLLSDFFMMILHVSLEDLQRFAGKSGEDEACLAHDILKGWTRTPESRIAIWHAGQVLRGAKTITPTQLRGFNAIVLYYASLTLWAYGLLTSPNSLDSITTLSFRATTPLTNVVLNGPEMTQISAFKANGKGAPGIRALTPERSTIFVPLTDTDKILEIGRDIYRSNFPVAEEPLPPLVVNLANLLKDLSSYPSSKVSRAASVRLE